MIGTGCYSLLQGNGDTNMYIWEIKHSPLGAEVRTHSALGSHALSPILYPPYVPIGHVLCNTYIAHACSARC